MPRFQLFAFVSALLVGATPAIAQISPACKPVLDGAIRLTTTPHHAVSTESDGKTVIEVISADGANYLKTHGVWKKSPLTSQDDLARQHENIKSVKVYTCSQLPDDSVDGVPAFVYKVQSEIPDVGSSDAQIWLSKATGLPLRTEDDFNTGTNRHISIKYDYANIKAPVVK
jgi:outer membrane lipoprotein-sorting protein